MTSQTTALARGGARGLAHGLSDRLRSQILSGELATGSRLPTESALCGAYGVSRTVVREALQHLQAAGLVETFQGRGSFVLAVPLEAGDGPLASVRSEADLVDLIEFRIAIESEAAGLAALRRTPGQLAAIERALEAFAEAASSPSTVVASDFELHLAVARASHNRFLASTLESFGPRMIMLQRTGLDERSEVTAAGHFERVLIEHTAFVEAIAAQDPAAAAASMRSHLAGSRRRLRRP